MKQYLEKGLCACGKNHSAEIYDVAIGKGVIAKLGQYIKTLGGTKPFVLADRNTYSVAGQQVTELLDKENVPYGQYVFNTDALEPDEAAVGSAVMHYDVSCDLIIGIGSGVINDIGKVLSQITGKPYIIIATAPSMDGYASNSSSMARDGLKVSLPTRCADVIIGDTDILKTAPEKMLKAGIGDMLAKYISIAEWRISHLINGEYYCEQIASLVRTCLEKCVNNAEGLLKREDAAIEAVFEGLVVGGIAMAYAGVSRPASGVEHYFSHIWDMRGLSLGTQVELHGIQCALGALQAVKLYEAVKKITPDPVAAKKYVAQFSYDQWKTKLRTFLGNSAEVMIAQESREKKYDKAAHSGRLERICDQWDAVLKILDEELPAYEELAGLMDRIGISKDLETIGVDRETAKLTFQATKDIRNKYVLSHLAWDLGILDVLSEML